MHNIIGAQHRPQNNQRQKEDISQFHMVWTFYCKVVHRQDLILLRCIMRRHGFKYKSGHYQIPLMKLTILIPEFQAIAGIRTLGFLSQPQLGQHFIRRNILQTIEWLRLIN
jgi:hypothetical protein